MSSNTTNATDRKTLPLPLPSPSSTVCDCHIASSPAPGQHSPCQQSQHQLSHQQQQQQQSWPKPPHQRTKQLQQQHDHAQSKSQQQRSAARNNHKQQKRAERQDQSQSTHSPSHEQQPLSESTTTPSSASSSEHVASPRVVYGPGTISRLPNELGRLRVTSPLIISSPSRVSLSKRVQALIPNLNSRILDSSVINVPTRVIDDVVSRISGRDCVISVGGGSAVSLARAVSLRKGIPHVCIPTTYSGSEVVPTSSKKCGIRDSKILPTVVIYDEELTMSQPKRISAPLTHTHPSESRHRSKDEDASWSYIHLPGV